MDQNEILKYVEPVLHFCRKRLNSPYDAEDLANDILLHVLTGIKKYEIESLDAWVWRVAHNRYARFINAQSRNKMILSGDEYLLESAGGGQTGEDDEAEYQAVFKYLHTLSTEYRNIFIDYYVGEKNVRDLSVKYSLPETTIKWRLSEGRRKIRERIGEDKMDRVYKRINWNTTVCNGNLNTDEYLHSQIARAICLTAYEKPLTVDEISMATGIPAMYIEDELPRLEYGDAVKRTGNKYAADFIILRLEDRKKLETASGQLIGMFADYFEKQFSEKAEEVKKSDFYGHDFGMERLGYIVIPYVIRNMIRAVKRKLRLENGPYPVRKDGGYGWMIVEETEDERENAAAYNSGCDTTGDDTGCRNEKPSHIYYYWISKYFDPAVYHVYGIQRMYAKRIPQSSENGIIHTELSDEEAAHYIRNGLIEKCGSQYKLRFACFTYAAFREFVSRFEADGGGLETPLGEWIKDIRETFASFVPERLDSQINQWVFNYANQLTGYVCEEMIRRGVLKKPEGDIPLTDGVFYAESEYIRNV